MPDHEESPSAGAPGEDRAGSEDAQVTPEAALPPVTYQVAGDGSIEQAAAAGGHEQAGEVGPAPGWAVDADGSVDSTTEAAGESTHEAAGESTHEAAGESTGESTSGEHQGKVAPVAYAVAADGSIETSTSAAGSGASRTRAEAADREARQGAAGEPADGGAAKPPLPDAARRALALASRADRAVAREARRRSREARRARRGTGTRDRQAKRQRAKRRTWGQRLVLAMGALTTLSVGASAAGLGYMYRKVEQIPRVELGHVLADPVASGQPRNVLLVGLDAADGIDSDDPIHADRDDGPPLADTIMILRIDPADQQARMLSLPRDLWVTYPGTQSTSRINTAIWRGDGSPDVLIDLIDDYLGIPIHNYVHVDFAGFRQLVDEIDGVPVYFDRPGRDRESGLHVYDSGCVTLDADAALAYVRARHYEDYIDGSWTREGRSDLARVERQQAFIRHTVDRAVNRGARNPGTLNSMVDASISSVTLDDELTVRDLVALGQRFQSFDPDAMETYVLPADDDVVGGAQVLRMNESEAEPILQLFRGAGTAGDDHLAAGDGSGRAEGTAGESPPADRGTAQVDGVDDGLAPGEVGIAVLNGSGQSGQATEAAAELDQAGFPIVGRDNAGQFGQVRTEVRYPSGLASEAAYVERWLASEARLVEDPELVAVTVLTGENWAGLLPEPRPPMRSGDGRGSVSTGTVLPSPLDQDEDEAELEARGDTSRATPDEDVNGSRDRSGEPSEDQAVEADGSSDDATAAVPGSPPRRSC